MGRRPWNNGMARFIFELGIPEEAQAATHSRRNGLVFVALVANCLMSETPLHDVGRWAEEIRCDLKYWLGLGDDALAGQSLKEALDAFENLKNMPDGSILSRGLRYREGMPPDVDVQILAMPRAADMVVGVAGLVRSLMDASGETSLPPQMRPHVLTALSLPVAVLAYEFHLQQPGALQAGYLVPWLCAACAVAGVVGYVGAKTASRRWRRWMSGASEGSAYVCGLVLLPLVCYLAYSASIAHPYNGRWHATVLRQSGTQQSESAPPIQASVDLRYDSRTNAYAGPVTGRSTAAGDQLLAVERFCPESGMAWLRLRLREGSGETVWKARAVGFAGPGGADSEAVIILTAIARDRRPWWPTPRLF